MSEIISRKPRIRFKGFVDDWEQRELGCILDEFIEKSKIENEYPILSSTNVGMEVREGRVSGQSNVGYKKISDGDLVLSPQNLWLGNININHIGTGLVSPSYRTFRFRNCDSRFIEPQLGMPKMMEAYKNSSTQGASVVRRNLDIELFNQITITLPCIFEQQQIGTFFQTLDNLITLHQRKLDKTKELKKSLLSKMFPKDGFTKPELRFREFTDDWEQCRLGDVADIVRGASPRPIQDPKWFDENSDIGWLRISDVTEQDGRIYHLEQHISELGQQKTRVLVEPHLLLSIAATVGKPVVNYVKTGVHDGFLIFLNPRFGQEFMFQWLEMFRSKWQKYGQPGSQVNLNSDLVKNQEIMLPIEAEQTKIGQFFQTIDNLITLHQRELDILKNLKKSLLQQMFVQEKENNNE